MSNIVPAGNLCFFDLSTPVIMPKQADRRAFIYWGICDLRFEIVGILIAKGLMLNA
jgi:hypothetical protein